jgi:hypothetical protein
VASSANKQGFPLVRARRNAPERELGHRSAHHHNSLSHRYILTYKVCVFALVVMGITHLLGVL